MIGMFVTYRLVGPLLVVYSDCNTTGKGSTKTKYTNKIVNYSGRLDFQD